MRRLPVHAVLVCASVGLFAVSGCTVDNGTALEEPPPVVPLCQTNNTATVEFRNTSNTNTTYDIVWDGSKLTVVAPGQTSSKYTVAAGIQHTMVFKATNTNNNACTPSTPTFAQCSVNWLSCSG